MQNLAMLYLHQNLIKEITGLDKLTNLTTLNLSHNRITKLSGLEKCQNLERIDISHNHILDIDECSALHELKQLTCLDLRENHIDTPNTVIAFFEKIPSMNCLYMSKNPCVRKISGYRKNLTIAMPNLHYLDERPLFEAERLTADAFKRGGKEEEERVRQEWADNKKRREKENIDRGARIEEESRGTRKQAFKQMMSELKESKSNDLVVQRAEFKKLYKLQDDSQMASYYMSRMKQVEQLMRQDWYIKLNKEGKEITPEMGKPTFMTKKKFMEDVENKVSQRNEVLARIAKDRATLNGQELADKIDMIISDSDDQHQQGIWSEDQKDDDEDKCDSDIEVMHLKDVMWTPKYELQLENMLLESGFDFKQTAHSFQAMLNRDLVSNVKEYHISAKDLQLKWTNIEIKNSQKMSKAKQEAPVEPEKAAQKITLSAAKITPEPEEEIDEETERKENMITNMGFELGHSVKEEKPQHYVSSNLIGYDSDNANDLEALD